MNVYKDFVIVHNMRLDPRDVKLFVDWLKCCEKNSAAYLIGEAMQAAIDNYVAATLGFTHSKNIHEDIYYDNEAEQEGAEND